jgi:hypothetical protein
LILSQKHNRGALAAARALASCGWRVGCGSEDRRTALVARSGSTSAWHRIRPPERDLHGFIDDVGAAVRSGGYNLVLPSNDAETLALSFGRDRIPCAVPYPAHDLVLAAFDKLRLIGLAARAGIASPNTASLTDRELSQQPFPVVLKARLHWRPGAQGVPHGWRTTICHTPEQVRRRAEEIRAAGGDAILQEVVQGRLLHYSLVVDGHGRAAACVAQRSEPDVVPPYTYPPVVGTRVRSISVETNEGLKGQLESILRELGWIGFASFMFIHPPQADPLLVDFNGRIPGSFQQSIAASPDLPHLWASIATGRGDQTAVPTQVGLRFQWLEGDLRRAVRERRGGVVHDVLGCFSYARDAEQGVWTRDDPLPALVYWAQLVGDKLRHLREGGHAAR